MMIKFTHIKEVIKFNEAEIIEAISELNSNSAAGPDGFPLILLMECKNELGAPIFYIWRTSLD